MPSWPPASLVTKWGTADDSTIRFGRLAAIENDVLGDIDQIVTMLGATPQGAYSDVSQRLAALSAGQSGMKVSVRAGTVYGPSYTFATAFQNAAVLDGVTLATNDRIILAHMADATKNGIYTVNNTGAPTRATDMASGGDVPGAIVYVREGASNAGRLYANFNSGTVTIGSTAINFGPIAVRPTSIIITPSNNPVGGDFTCDGTADEFEINLAIFFLILSTVAKGEIKLAAGDFFLASQISLGGAVLDFVGSGRSSTIIHRTADVIALDQSGTGTGAHTGGPCRIANLQVKGSHTPHTAPAIRLYYCDNVVVEDVFLNTMTSVGILGLEVWDTTFSRVHCTNVGSAGLSLRGGFGAGNVGTTGGNPSVLLVGDTATSGFGHTTSSCNGLRFRDCIFDGSTDCAVQAHGNAAAENFVGQTAVTHTDFEFTGCQFNASAGRAGWAPQMNLYRCAAIDIPYASSIQGNWFTGGSARNIFQFDTCSEVHIGRLALFAIEANASVASWVRFTGACSNVAWDLITLEATTAPVTSVVDVSGATTGYRSGGVAMQQSGPAIATVVTGLPTSAYRVSSVATIPTGGATSVVVTHLLVRQPKDGEVILTAVSKPSTNDPGHIWVDTYTPTQFTIHCTNAPTGTALNVAWRATVDDNG